MGLQNQSSQIEGSDMLAMTSQIVASFVANNQIDVDDIPNLIKQVHLSLSRLSGGDAHQMGLTDRPAVPIDESITPDHLICLEDGKKLKMLKRHLRTAYGMTPEQYRAKWNLPTDYPMVAPNYAKQRSAFAKEIGLGRNRSDRMAG